MTEPPINRLRELRGEKRRHVLAVELGVGPTTIFRWETDPHALRTSRMAERVAEHFGVSLGYLLGLEEPSEQAA